MSASQTCPGAPAAQSSADSHLRAMAGGGGGQGLSCVPCSRGASVRIPCEPEAERACFLLGACLCLGFIVTFPV